MKKKETKKEDEKDIQEIIREIKEEFGEGAIMTFVQKPVIEVETISTGCPALDLALGVGGLPRGRIIEIFGPESSGKTTLALEVIAEAQKKDGKAAFIDVEHALDPEYAKKIGVDLEKLIISQPDSAEDALNIVERLVKSSLFDVIVVDSVAALLPRAELEGEIGDQQIGLQARIMSQALRKLTGLISKTKTIVIFLNQTRAKIGGFGFMPGGAETTPGGKALKFYASVRIELKKIAQIKKGAEIIGNKIKAKVVKNKVAPPFRTAEFDIFYNKGIDDIGNLLNLALKYEIIKKSGQFLVFEDKKIGSSPENAKKFIQENNLYEEIFKKIKEKVLAS
jgi:recombination protein RecA